MPEEKQYYHWQQLNHFVIALLSAQGFQHKDAIIIADTLIEANLKGKDSHGLIRLPHYMDRYQRKSIQINPTFEFDHKGDAALVLDGDHGPGQLIGVAAMEKAMQVSEQQGICVVVAKKSSHFGMAGYYAELAAKNNMIGMAMTHSDKNTVPYGSAEPYFGSNSLAFSVPTNEPYCLTIDFCTAKITFGDIYDATLKNKKLPAHCVLDQSGQYTDDPHLARFLTPVGGHKGYGLAFMIEILCAQLTGIPFCKHINHMYNDLDHPRNLGHFFMVINIERFFNLDFFKSNISTMIAEIHDLKKAQGTDQIFVHGEKSYLSQQQRKDQGIWLKDSLSAELMALGEQLGVTFPAPLSSR